MQNAVAGQVGEVFLVGFGRLQIHRRHRTASLGNARAGVIAVDLDDVVLAARPPQEAAPLAGVSVHGRMAEDVADIGGVTAGGELHDGRHELDGIDIAGAVHESGLGFLAARTADHQNALPGVALEVVRSQDADLPEVLVDFGTVTLDGRAQAAQIAVELVEVAGLIAAVVLDGLAIAAAVPRCGGQRGESLIDHVNL